MSDWHIKNNILRVVEILDAKLENPHVKTISFKDELCASAEPGQFVMIWIPGVDEIPLSISFTSPCGVSSVTVAEVGEATKELIKMKAGDLIGVRGPFGLGFKPIGKRVLLIGGGTGMAPLMLLVNKLIEENIEVTVIEGAESSKKLIFLDALKNLSKTKEIGVLFATEDGSYGVRGLATDLAKDLLRHKKFDVIYTCGPEKMIREVYELSNKYSIDLQASLERYMRCAIGICGSCIIGRYRVCRDGPVFNKEKIKEIENYLGILKYNERGEKVTL
ncbi:MAG: dihydroorotate dehydrogenase electron transfer subunit [Candidatus Bathyarchaeia archaeon]|nr:dihydroorotate dehydrogenase electron transfer subunit [Candidatus Bathyarchaeota archaeon]